MPEIEEIHVLIVDDSTTIRSVIEKHLGADYFAIHASNGEEAWQQIQTNNSISLVFADLHMPVMNGMLLLQQVRDSDCERIANLPIIMITGHEDTAAAKQASLNMGATDFISKPFSAVDIISRAGSYTKLNRKIATLEKNVTRDRLTGLFNQRGLQEQGEKAISSANRHRFVLSALAMEIENANEITDKHGSDIYEQILVSVANKLKESLRKEEELAHLGAGQFTILLPMTKAFRAHIVALRFQKVIDNLAFKTSDETIRIKLAIGLNSTEGYNQHITFSELNKQAEVALQTSLKERACKVVRHDETISKEQDDEEYNVSAPASGDPTDANNLDVELQNSETSDLGNYMSAILNGEFEKVPAQHIYNMIEPFESFIDFAYDHMQAELEKQQKNNRSSK